MYICNIINKKDMNIINLKFKVLLPTFITIMLCCSIISCKQNYNEATKKENAEVILKDYGPEPLVLDIEDYTEANNNFRTALWTGTNLQLTLMSIPVGGEIGLELHSDIDQFIRIEEGKGKVLMGDSKESLTFNAIAEDDYAIIIPAGKWHNLINIGDKPLKLYSIYSPVEHPHNTIHKTFEESEAAHH